MYLRVLSCKAVDGIRDECRESEGCTDAEITCLHPLNVLDALHAVFCIGNCLAGEWQEVASCLSKKHPFTDAFK